jgi:hypothetical protein
MFIADRNIAYCDLIADEIKNAINSRSGSWNAGNVQLDLHPTDGYFQSTKKTVDITDPNGRKYRVTVEEA